MSPQTIQPQRRSQLAGWHRAAYWIAGAVAALIFLSVVALAVLPFIAMPMMGLNSHVDFNTVYTPEQFNLTAEEVTLVTEDNLGLQAWFAPSQTAETAAAIIFLSGIQYPSVTAFFPHAAWLAQEGYASMPIEVRAHGGSDGDQVGLGITDALDVKAAVSYLRARLPGIPIIVFGVSMGGATAINAFGELPEISGCIALSAYSSWPDVFCQTMTNYYHIPSIISMLEKPFVWLYSGITFGFDKLHINPLAEIRKADGRPILLMQSLEDSTVAYENYEELLAAAPHAESFLRDGDNHLILSANLFMTPQEDTAYAEAVLEFLGQFSGS